MHRAATAAGDGRNTVHNLHYAAGCRPSSHHRPYCALRRRFRFHPHLTYVTVRRPSATKRNPRTPLKAARRVFVAHSGSKLTS